MNLTDGNSRTLVLFLLLLYKILKIKNQMSKRKGELIDDVAAKKSKSISDFFVQSSIERKGEESRKSEPKANQIEFVTVAKPKYNLLKDRCPNIFSQIHPTKNDPKVDLNKLTCGSQIKLWWKCAEHKTCERHVWKASVVNRTKGKCCRFCAGKEVCMCDSFGTKFPDLLKEFVAAGNDETIAYATACGTNKEFLWKCLKHKSCDQHIWKASVINRTLNKHCCVFCAARRTCVCDSFGRVYPRLLEEFIAAGNDQSIAFSTSCGSGKEFFWKCVKHKSCDQHIWKASVNCRTDDHGCRFCARKETCRCDSFGSIYPHLLEDFMRAGGAEDIAFSTACGSKNKLQWQCKEGHQWPAAVLNRTRIIDPTGCPDCTTSQFETSFQNLLEQFSISSEPQKKFEACRNKLPLPFDAFFMTDCLAELDGPQHFEDVFGEKSLESTQKHDAIKNKFASDQNMHLFRIAWSERSRMEKHLTDFIERVKVAGTMQDRARIERFYGREYGEKNCLMD